jgi:hypothetical protein
LRLILLATEIGTADEVFDGIHQLSLPRLFPLSCLTRGLRLHFTQNFGKLNPSRFFSSATGVVNHLPDTRISAQ